MPGFTVHLPGSLHAGGQFAIHLLPMIRVISKRAINFAQRELRMIECQFLGTPAVGHVLLNQMNHFEILPGNDGPPGVRAIQMFVSKGRD